jgi:hypothetical protein
MWECGKAEVGEYELRFMVMGIGKVKGKKEEEDYKPFRLNVT